MRGSLPQEFSGLVVGPWLLCAERRVQLRCVPRSTVLAAASFGGYRCGWRGTEENGKRQEKLGPAETEEEL